MLGIRWRGSNSISVRLILAIVAFSSFIAFFTTGVQLYLDYRVGTDRIHREFAKLKVVTISPLSTSVWELAEETIQLQLDSLVNHPDISYAAIVAEGKISWKAGKEPEGDTISANYPIIYERIGARHELGHLRIVAGLSDIYGQILQKFYIILGTNFLKTLIVSAFMYFLFHIFLTKRLMALAEFARNVELSDLAKPFQHTKAKIESKRTDEFDDIANAMNQMRANLKDSYDELVTQKDRLAEAQKVAKIGSFERDILTGKIYWSDETYRLFGLAPQEIEMTVEELLSRVHHEDREIISNSHFKTIGENVLYQESYRILLPDGGERMVQTEGEVFRDETGNPVRVVGTIRDLTEQKRAEEEREEYIERLMTLNRLTQQMSTSLDLDEVLESVMESARSLLDLSDIAVFIRQEDSYFMRASLGDYFSADPKRRYEVGEGGIGLATEKKSTQFIGNVGEYPRWKRPELARKFGIQTSLSVPLKNEGKITGVLSCLTREERKYTEDEVEIVELLANMAAIAMENAETHSNLRRTLEELRQSQEMIIRAEKLSSLGTLAAGAAHEILNPAGVIQLRAELIAEDMPTDSLEQASAKIIIQNVKRIKEICDDLRKFSRDDVPSAESFDPCDALMSSLGLIKHEFSPMGIKFEVKKDAANSVFMGDFNQMQQVFLNLLSNAKDAMPNGGELTISTSTLEIEGKSLWDLRISDTGIGIPEEDLPNIFDPFFTTKPPDKGTGLGLSVLHGIVKNHGGEVFVDSEMGRGATFTVRLPMGQE